MMATNWDRRLVEKRVTYTLALGDEFYIVENVLARVNEETGEQFFSSATVERLHETILRAEQPKRILETPVYEFSE